ncbi:AbrB/MazE/SpoVT family DNA-binding domain-containing protein [Actinokineospora sp.]|uniref:AbrB/MazE/SpoVT family DNA-binding domain-containing protein n=1 Tax=Actinokineospora sp. TaxID=1872133 RepID=UPI0040379711
MSTPVKRSDDGSRVRTTKVSSKNQVTLPVAALAAAHVRPGDVLRVEVEADGVFRLIRHTDPFLDALDELAGSAPGLTAAVDLQELRDEWER